MQKITLVVLFFVAQVAVGQTKLNTTLKRQLDSVFVLDQKYRKEMNETTNLAKRDSLSKVLSVPADQLFGYFQVKQSQLDANNIIFIEKIFDQYGYPGKTLVGGPTNEAAWNIVQHSSKIAQYLPLIKKAADGNELPFTLYAIMLDRDLVRQGKEQIYGTQIQGQKLKNGKFELFVWPIQEPETVNERRKKVGFDLTVEENAKRLNTTYRVLKMDEIK